MARHDAEKKAAEVLREAKLDTSPIDPAAVAAALGARVVYQRMDTTVSGMTYRQGADRVIGVNSSHHPRRQRFTLAHEVGHLSMHEGKPLLVDSTVRVDFRDGVSSLATDAEEIEANAFAAALLMPEDLVRARIRSLQAGGVRSREPLIKALATEFDVSAEAMTYRLLNLGLITA